MKTYLILVLSFFVILTLAYGQRSGVSSPQIKGSLKSKPLPLPKENVYLQFDKTNYNPGDTVWFKGVLTVGDNHQLSELSNIMYVELIDSQDSVIRRSILYVSDGLTFGNIPVAAAYPPGQYRIRAYTKFMCNSSPDYFFNAFLNFGIDSTKKQTDVLPPSIALYPEGGRLVNGIRSKVAVSVSAPNSLMQNLSGTVTDDEHNEVAGFTVGPNGLGAFAITPVKGKNYKTYIKTANKNIVCNLPNIQSSGFTLTVNSLSADSIYATISGKEALTENQPGYKVRLIAHAKGNIYYSAVGNFSEKPFRSSIPKNCLPPGVVQLVLLSPTGEILSTRNVYIKASDRLLVELKNKATDKSGFVTHKLIAKTNAGGLVSGSFGVSVTKLEDTLNINPWLRQDIYTNIDLTSNYNSSIQNPTNFLKNDNPDLLNDLDLLMLTQQGFKYNWGGQNLAYEDSIKHQPEKSLTLEGVIKTPGGNIVKGAKVSLYAISAGLKLDTLTNDFGYFRFQDLDLADSTKLLIKAEKKGISGFNIYIAAPDYPKVNTLFVSNKPAVVDSIFTVTPNSKSTNASYPISQNKTHILKEVKIKSRKIPKPDISNKYGTDNSYTLSGDFLKDLGPLSIGLRSKIPGAFYRDGVYYSVHTVMNRHPKLHVVFNYFEIPPDEIDDYVSQYDVEDVKILEGYTYKTLYGVPYDPSTLGYDDIILITTKAYAGNSKQTYSLNKVLLKVSDETGKIKERAYYTGFTAGDKLSYNFPGYAQQHVFSPTPGGLKNQKKLKLDKTFYWNPDIIPDSSGEVSFTFKQPFTGTYLIKIEGIDGDGNLGSVEYRYKAD